MQNGNHGSKAPKKRNEQEWNDQIPDDESDLPQEYEKTYRDGSAQNECWNVDR